MFANITGYAIFTIRIMNKEVPNGIIHQGKLHLLVSNTKTPECYKCSLQDFCFGQKGDICLCEVLDSPESHFTEQGQLIKVVPQNPMLN